VTGEYLFRPGEEGFAAGNKATLLKFLMDRGHRVPTSHFCSLQAFDDSSRDPEAVMENLRSELENALSPDKTYAVRSSANVEDRPEGSYAGQFRTVLGVTGVDRVLEAIQQVWRSAQSDRVQKYAGGKGDSEIRMGVIIQEMVEPVFSGVSFSRNPMTGLDEVVVEAVKGKGTALVQDGTTPERWINKWGEWLLKPEGTELPLGVVSAIVTETKAIEKEYGRPVDLEWVYDGREIFWVQLREIMLDDVNVYSNKISREVLPGMIRPLVWSVNIPLVNGAWIRLFTELIGENDIQPDSLSKQIYYRAYFNMGVIGRIFEALGMPRESLEILMGIESNAEGKPKFKPTRKTILQLPRLVEFVVDKLRFSRKFQAFLPRMEAGYREIADTDLSVRSDADILSGINQIFDLTQETAYYNIVVPLLMQLYNRMLGSQLAAAGINFEEVDITRGMEGLKEIDPNFHLSKLHAQYSRLAEGEEPESYDDLCAIPGAEDLCGELDRFIERFGHFSESGNDFSAVPWRENPDFVLDMVAHFQPAPQANQPSLDDLSVPLLHRPLVSILHERAREYRLAREQISSLYTYGYGLFRRYFLELGRRLAAKGLLLEPSDIFYLYLDEIRGTFSAEGGAGNPKDLVEQRRAEMDKYRDIPLPTIVYGDHPPPVYENVAGTLKGTPTSRGYYTGPVRVIESSQDFGELTKGDVLVVPYSDVAWTPLFAMAGAVVAESGGILSHSSIVAREHGIPAVVSVDGAMSLADGTTVSVDGFTGDIIVHDSDDPQNRLTEAG